jgi:regulator of protease activity HflC (stomatin/prohibitin superfamily)
MDPASQSLSDALRVSFRLLTIIMIVVVIFFALSGFKSVEETERGVVRVLGEIQRVAEPGFVYTWPFPAGDIQLVDANEQTMNVDDFWMYVAPEERGKDISEIRPRGEGLQPGWDGALLSGDRYLFHVRIRCTYVIRDAEAYVMNVSDTDELVRSVVCQAAIRAAGLKTADRIRNNRDEFVTDVQDEAQARLRAVNSGITLTSVELPKFTWPLRALDAFEAETAAITEKSKQMDEARGQAEKMLAATAGQEGYRKLVGQPWEDDPNAPDSETYDLIGQYERARREGDDLRAKELLAQIDQILISDVTQGEASAIIEQARRYKATVRERVAARARQFQQLLPRYRETPELFIRKHWLATREEILSSPTMYRQYLPVLGNGKTVLYLGMEGEILRAMKRQELKEQREQRIQEAAGATLREDEEDTEER